MKNTSTEWLFYELQRVNMNYALEQIENLEYIEIKHKILEQAKEMEQKQQDELAIGFSEWCLDENQIIYGDGEELLQIYKTKLKNENK